MRSMTYDYVMRSMTYDYVMRSMTYDYVMRSMTYGDRKLRLCHAEHDLRGSCSLWFRLQQLSDDSGR